MIYIIYLFIDTLIHGVDVPGYFTMIAAVLFIGGIQLVSIGVIGEYIGRIYYEVKQRPKYIVEASNVGMPKVIMKRNKTCRFKENVVNVTTFFI